MQADLPEHPQSVLFVCTGNICRSPTAEGIFRKLCKDSGIKCTIASRGLTSYHRGEPPSTGAIEMAAKKGYDLSQQRASTFRPRDFDDFEVIFGMTAAHVTELHRLLKLHNPRALDKPVIALFDSTDVPDPYYGDEDLYEKVLIIIERCCKNLFSKMFHPL